MEIEFCLVLAATLVGIGIGSALSRKNIISIVMAMTTGGLGVLIAMAALDRRAATNDDGMLFALCLAAHMMVVIVLGCALAYRRFMTGSTSNIGDENRLRH